MAVLSVVNFLPFLAAANIIYFVGLCIYRIFFHPLAKYPGPLLSKVSQWPEAISSWSGRRHLDFHLCHEKYGDIVRVSPNKLSFRTAEALQDIYTDRKANVVKTGWTTVGLAINPNVTTHVLADRKLHAARRRLLNNAFSEQALKSLEKYVLERIREWCSRISEPETVDEKKSGWSKEIDMGHWSTLLTVDILGELCFGSSFGAMKNGASYINNLLLSSASFQQAVAFIPGREFLFPIMTPKWLGMMGKATGNQNILQKVRFRNDIAKYVEKRFALEKETAGLPDEEKRRDFFHYLLTAKDPQTGDKFLPKDLVGEAALLVGAGSDTSSTAMSALFFYLCRHPRVLQRLQDEVCGAFSNIEDITYTARLTSLPYLRACVDEAMRVAPPVPGSLDRVVIQGGADIDGVFLPEGTVVGVPIYAIHHNERYFPRPYDFLPERWIAGDKSSEVTGFPVTATSVNLCKAAFHAFSSGPRGCVGKNMAYMELLVGMARIAFLFDMRLKAGDHTGEGRPGWEPGRERREEYQLTDWLISDREGPLMQFKPREQGVVV